MTKLREAICMAVVLCLLGVGCAKRVESEAVEPTDGAKDYGQLLRNVRERSAATMAADRLLEAIEEFETELGRSPTNLTEVVRYGFIDAIPEPPKGMAFSYDPTNSVFRTVPVEL